MSKAMIPAYIISFILKVSSRNFNYHGAQQAYDIYKPSHDLNDLIIHVMVTRLQALSISALGAYYAVINETNGYLTGYCQAFMITVQQSLLQNSNPFLVIRVQRNVFYCQFDAKAPTIEEASESQVPINLVRTTK